MRIWLIDWMLQGGLSIHRKLTMGPDLYLSTLSFRGTRNGFNHRYCMEERISRWTTAVLRTSTALRANACFKLWPRGDCQRSLFRTTSCVGEGEAEHCFRRQ
eukprot:2000833-Pyramimonas_sp.AAC.1